MMYMEKLDYLIEYLLEEQNQHRPLPANLQEKERLYRGLVNLRAATPISPDFLEIEDAYLQEELKAKEVTDVRTLQTISEQYQSSTLRNADKTCLWQGDITALAIDAIVNAANSQGLGCFVPNHNCIDNQIHTSAGVRLRLACDEIMQKMNYQLDTGKAILTPGYNLPAKSVIHTVGPIIEGDVTAEDKAYLAACYRNSLELAAENGLKTVAFPCISTGVFRFPKAQASQIALKAVDGFLSENSDVFDKIVFNLWSKEDVIIYEQNIGNHP